LPANVTGYTGYPKNSAAFEQAKKGIRSDNQHFSITNHLESELEKQRVPKEMIASLGLSFIRKRQNGKHVYFIANLSDQFSKGWIEMGSGSSGHFSGYNPLTGEKFTLSSRKSGKKEQLFLSLLPGQSCFIREESEPLRPLATQKLPKDYSFFELRTKWKLQFLGGRPEYHQTFDLPTLQSWTTLSDTAAIFSGTARYVALVPIPDAVVTQKDLLLDLGNVKESAVVKINDTYIGTVWCIPFQLKIPPQVLKSGENKVEIEVTNLSANYMRWYDPQHPEWRRFYDINMVDITYKRFNAGAWPIMPSGLCTDNLKIGFR
jgi:hypothetical protein